MALILIVEDDEDIRSTLSEILYAEGHRVLQAANGKVTKLLEDNTVDLVITDILMPERDGIEVLLELRNNFPRTRAIALSGGGRAGDLVYLNMARRLGAFTYAKPVAVDTLLEAIRYLLETPERARVTNTSLAAIQAELADRPIPST